MAITKVVENAQLTVINSEHSLTQQTNIVGIHILKVDVSAMIAGDTVVIRMKDKIRGADPTQTTYIETLSGLQTTKNWQSIPIPTDAASELICTLEQTTGLPRTYPWKLMRM